MIWLTWRQFRGQFLTALTFLVASAVYLLFLGQAIRHSYNTDIVGCLPVDGCDLSAATDRFLNEYDRMVTLAGVLLVLSPAIIGIFWGAPLVARELETNTHHLAWNQGVTRTRWLAVKLAVIGGASAVITGSLSLLLTWAASRYDQVEGDRFLAVVFAARNIVPVGYVVLAFVLGTTMGLVIRRTLPAMAATLLVLAAIQIIMPTLARPHLQAPVTERIAFTTERDAIPFSTSPDGPVEIRDYTIPDAWMLTSTSYLYNESGEPVDRSSVLSCVEQQEEDPDSTADCLAGRNYYFDVTYQPAKRYWTFQWLELAILLASAALVSGFVLWRIRHIQG